MTAKPFIKPRGVLVIGNSAGGWGALALAARNLPSVAGVVNFSGGRGGHNHNVPESNCAPERLVEAAGTFGQTAHIPTLWLYAQNDTYFSPTLATAMFNEFQTSGGRGRLVIVPAVGSEGHALINASGAPAVWMTPLAGFLSQLR